jgi:DNA helicase MCM8
MALAIVSLAPSSAADKIERFLDSTQIVVRFAHVQPQIQMVNIKTGLVGKFVSVKGHVVKARPKRLRVATADFACQKCGATHTHRFDVGRYSVPAQCAAESCRSRSFALLRPTARYVNVQDLRLQEAQEESTAQAGRNPRQVDVELARDLVDACRPGDTVLVAATVAAVNAAVAAGVTGKRASETSTYKLYLQGHSVTSMSETNNNNRRNSGRDHGSQVIYTQQQLRSITQLCHADHRYFGLTERRAFPFDLLVRSLCPSIIGHNEVKAGLLLCLLGGTPPSSSGPDRTSIRCNSHMLIVGGTVTDYLPLGRGTLLVVCSSQFVQSFFFFLQIQAWVRVRCCWQRRSWRPGMSMSVEIRRQRLA